MVCVGAHKHAVTFKNNHMGKKQTEEPRDQLAFDLCPSPGPVLGLLHLQLSKDWQRCWEEDNLGSLTQLLRRVRMLL